MHPMSGLLSVRNPPGDVSGQDVIVWIIRVDVGEVHLHHGHLKVIGDVEVELHTPVGQGFF